jgi:hypothetical protein
VHFQFQYLLFIKYILNKQLAMRLQRNSTIALEIFPVGLWLAVPRRRVRRLLIHVVLAMPMNNYVLVFENLGIRLPIGINENAGTPNWKFFLARMEC